MTRLRVLVADDEPLARRMVAALVRQDAEVEAVLECADGDEARAAIARERPDIVFLDIEMPGASGIDVAAAAAGTPGDVNGSEEGPVVVFVTAFSQYAARAFEVEASDYVLKPFTDARFADALERAKRRVRQRRLGELASQLGTLSTETRPAEREYLKSLAFKHDDRAVVLTMPEIVWIEAEDYYVRVHSKQGRYLVRASLASLEARLDPREFLRVHRAAIVNVSAVRGVQDTGTLTVLLTDGAAVPVSRSRKPHVESVLLPRFRP